MVGEGTLAKKGQKKALKKSYNTKTYSKKAHQENVGGGGKLNHTIPRTLAWDAGRKGASWGVHINELICLKIKLAWDDYPEWEH